MTDSTHPAVAYFGSIRRLAAAIGRSNTTFSARLREGRPLLTAEEAIALEEASGGELKRGELRPDLWPPA